MQYIFNLRGVKIQSETTKNHSHRLEKQKRNIESWINILLFHVQWRAHKKCFEGFL